MSNVKREMATRCELALMGKVVEVRSNDEVQAMTEYLLSAIGVSEQYANLDVVTERICKYSDNNEVKYLVCNTLMGQFPVITYLIDTNEEEEPKPFEEDWGTGTPCSFCYVFNPTADDLSEFGDCFFSKKTDGFYHRVS